MSKSIFSRVVWGYGILILILILMISAFVVNRAMAFIESSVRVPGYVGGGK